MLYLFDLDGTLISSYMDNPDKAYDRWDVLPGRRDKITALRAAGHHCHVVSNQAGVAFGHITEQAARDKLSAACVAAGLDSLAWRACFDHPQATDLAYRRPSELRRRKPHGAMIREWQDLYPGLPTLFIGDRPEDEQAADDAEVPFRWADAFFAGGIG